MRILDLTTSSNAEQWLPCGGGRQFSFSVREFPQRSEFHDHLEVANEKVTSDNERVQPVMRGEQVWKCSGRQISCVFQELETSSRTEARNSRICYDSVSGGVSGSLPDLRLETPSRTEGGSH